MRHGKVKSAPSRLQRLKRALGENIDLIANLASLGAIAYGGYHLHKHYKNRRSEESRFTGKMPIANPAGVPNKKRIAIVHEGQFVREENKRGQGGLGRKRHRQQGVGMRKLMRMGGTGVKKARVRPDFMRGRGKITEHAKKIAKYALPIAGVVAGHYINKHYSHGSNDLIGTRPLTHHDHYKV